jgi:uncharacterized membrane protein YgdD (TMEM256/DUF423 family)
VFGGALGMAAGLALMAAGGHAGADPRLATAGQVLALNAAGLLGLGGWMAAAGGSRACAIGSIAIAAGALLFGADLVARARWGVRLFPGAAPLGGMAMMAGWLVAAAGIALARRQA